MISLSCPQESANEVYLACADHTREPILRAALKTESLRVTERSAVYLSKAIVGELYSMTPGYGRCVSNAQLADLYERVLVKGGERATYEKLKSLARLGRCPLCAQRDVKTLDHYLPRAAFPEFSVMPANLVPSCTDCNKAKLAHVAKSYEQQSFHPYFDNWSEVILLKATPRITDRVDVVFSIQPQGVPTPHWINRAELHFQLLGLGNLYRQHAAVELVQCKDEFRDSYYANGPLALKEDLQAKEKSRSKPFLNAWQPALYRGLSETEEFYHGGFEKIEE